MGLTTQGPYFGSEGKKYILKSSVMAAGGEAEIYEVLTPSYPPLVAKIYKSGKATREHLDKIKAMIASLPNPPSELAWPKDILYTDATKKKFGGFVMQRVAQRQNLRDTYILDHRKNKKWSYFIRIARNLSAAVYNVHETGQVIGDFNAENILVDEKKLDVVIVDTDSFHIRDKKTNKYYPCLVGKPEFIAPELIDKEISKLPVSKTFNESTDNYSLAILIFCLLFNGSHPFTCIVKNQKNADKYQQEANIKNGMCIYFPESVPANLQADIPPYSPGINWVPEYLHSLFYRAFVFGFNNPTERPKPKEWYDALKKLETELKHCSSKKDHEYPRDSTYCPWCETVARFHARKPSAHANNATNRAKNTSKSNLNTSIPVASKQPTPITSKSKYNNAKPSKNLNFTILSTLKNPFEYWKEYLTQMGEPLPPINTQNYKPTNTTNSLPSNQPPVTSQNSAQPSSRIIGSSHVVVPQSSTYPIKKPIQTTPQTIPLASRPIYQPMQEEMDEADNGNNTSQNNTINLTNPQNLGSTQNIPNSNNSKTDNIESTGTEVITKPQPKETQSNNTQPTIKDENEIISDTSNNETNKIETLCAEIFNNLQLKENQSNNSQTQIANTTDITPDTTTEIIPDTSNNKIENIEALCAEISKNLQSKSTESRTVAAQNIAHTQIFESTTPNEQDTIDIPEEQISQPEPVSRPTQEPKDDNTHDNDINCKNTADNTQTTEIKARQIAKTKEINSENRREKTNNSPKIKRKSSKKRIVAIIIACLIILVSAGIVVGITDNPINNSIHNTIEKLSPNIAETADEYDSKYTLELSSDPAGATITFNGIQATSNNNGTTQPVLTPAVFTLDEEGKCTITLSKDGYIPVTQTVYFFPGQKRYRAEFVLEKIPEPTGTLRVNGNSGYVISLNGTTLGTLNSSGIGVFDGIKPGTYDLTIATGGNNKHTMSVTIEPDKINDISIGLAKN